MSRADVVGPTAAMMGALSFHILAIGAIIAFLGPHGDLQA